MVDRFPRLGEKTKGYVPRAAHKQMARRLCRPANLLRIAQAAASVTVLPARPFFFLIGARVNSLILRAL